MGTACALPRNPFRFAKLTLKDLDGVGDDQGHSIFGGDHGEEIPSGL